MAGDQILDEIWYDADTVFYMVVAMLTFTSIIGTLLYYKERLIARPQNEEEEEEEFKETLEVTPQWRDPVLQMSSESSSSSSESEEDISTETITDAVLSSTSNSPVKRSHSPTLIGEIGALDQIYEDGSSDQTKQTNTRDPLLTSDMTDPNSKFTAAAENQSSRFAAEQTHVPAGSTKLYCPPTPDTVRRRNLEIVVETDESEIEEIKTTKDHSIVIQNKLNTEYDNESEENIVVETCQKDKEKTDNELIRKIPKEQSFEIIDENEIKPVLDQTQESCPVTLPATEEKPSKSLDEQDIILKELSEEKSSVVPSEDTSNSITEEESQRNVQPVLFTESEIYPIDTQKQEAVPSLFEEDLVVAYPLTIDKRDVSTPIEKEITKEQSVHLDIEPGVVVEEDSSITPLKEHQLILPTPVVEQEEKPCDIATEVIIPIYVEEQKASPEPPNDHTEVTTEQVLQGLDDAVVRDSPIFTEGDSLANKPPEDDAREIDEEQYPETAAQLSDIAASEDSEKIPKSFKDSRETRNREESKEELTIRVVEIDQLQSEPSIEWVENQDLSVKQPEEHHSVNKQANEQIEQFPINEESIHKLAPECETNTPTSCIVENIKGQTAELIINTSIEGIDESTDPIIASPNQKDIDYLGSNQKEKLVIDSAKVVNDQSITAVAPQLKEEQASLDCEQGQEIDNNITTNEEKSLTEAVQEDICSPIEIYITECEPQTTATDNTEEKPIQITITEELFSPIEIHVTECQPETPVEDLSSGKADQDIAPEEALSEDIFEPGKDQEEILPSIYTQPTDYQSEDEDLISPIDKLPVIRENEESDFIEGINQQEPISLIEGLPVEKEPFDQPKDTEKHIPTQDLIVEDQSNHGESISPTYSQSAESNPDKSDTTEHTPKDHNQEDPIIPVEALSTECCPEQRIEKDKEQDETMGNLLTKIFETDKLDDVPLDRVEQLGGQIIISEHGDYAIINFEGKTKEYKIDKVKLRNQNSKVLNKKLRDSRDLNELFQQLESLDCVDENKDQPLLASLTTDNSDKGNVYDLDSLSKLKTLNDHEDDAVLERDQDSSPKQHEHVLNENNELIVNESGGLTLLSTNVPNDSLLDEEKSSSSNNSYKAVNQNEIDLVVFKKDCCIERQIEKTCTGVDNEQKQLLSNVIERDSNVEKSLSQGPVIATEETNKSDENQLQEQGEKEPIAISENDRSIPIALQSELNQEVNTESVTYCQPVISTVDENSSGGEIEEKESKQRPQGDLIDRPDAFIQKVTDNTNYPSGHKNVNNLTASNKKNDSIIVDDELRFKETRSNTTDVVVQSHQGVNQYQDFDDYSCSSQLLQTKDQQLNRICEKINKSTTNEQDLFVSAKNEITLIHKSLDEKDANYDEFAIFQQRSKSLTDLTKTDLLKRDEITDLRRTQSMDYLHRRSKPKIILSAKMPHHHSTSKIKETNLDDLMQMLQNKPTSPAAGTSTYDFILHLNDENNNNNESLTSQHGEKEAEFSPSLESSYSETEIDPYSSESEDDDFKTPITPHEKLSDNFKDCLHSDSTQTLKIDERTADEKASNVNVDTTLDLSSTVKDDHKSPTVNNEELIPNFVVEHVDNIISRAREIVYTEQTVPDYDTDQSLKTGSQDDQKTMRHPINHKEIDSSEPLELHPKEHQYETVDKAEPIDSLDNIAQQDIDTPANSDEEDAVEITTNASAHVEHFVNDILQKATDILRTEQQQVQQEEIICPVDTIKIESFPGQSLDENVLQHLAALVPEGVQIGDGFSFSDSDSISESSLVDEPFDEQEQLDGDLLHHLESLLPDGVHLSSAEEESDREGSEQEEEKEKVDHQEKSIEIDISFIRTYVYNILQNAIKILEQEQLSTNQIGDEQTSTNQIGDEQTYTNQIQLKEEIANQNEEPLQNNFETLSVPSEVAKEETNQPENVEEMSKQQQQVEEHTMKQDPSLFAVLSDVCDAYAPKTQDPNKAENLQSVVGSLADFEVNAAKDDVSCMAMIDTITNEKPPISKETQLESSNPMKSQSANSSPFKSQSSTSRSLQDALSIHDETFDGHLKDAILVKHKSSDSIDTLDMSLSSISDSEIPDTPELTHVSRDQTHDDESSFDSSECQLHITSESLSNDNSEITDVSHMDATLDETLDLSKDEGFVSSTPRKGVPPVPKERTVFEEIVETRTEIVVESTYEVEDDPEISDVEDCGDNKNDQDKRDNIPLIVEDLVDSTVDMLKQQENTENEESENQHKGDNIPQIVEELVDSTVESECNEAPRILDESTLSLAEGNIMDTTIDLKEAVIGEQTEPLNVAKKLLLDEESPVNKRKGKVKRNDSWRFSSDYRLSSSSQSLIDSIECDMEDEFLDGLDPEEDKIHQDVQEMLDVRGSLRSVDDVDKAPKKLTTLRSKDDGDNKVSPRRLKKGDKGREWKSKSLHSIFSTDQMETDIDDINEQELASIMKSPKLKEKHQGVFVTDVDKAFKSSPSTPTNETKKPKKYVVVSRRSNIRKYSADIPTTEDGLSTGLETRSKSLDTKRAPAVRSLIPKTKRHEKKANDLPQETDIDLEDEAFETEPSTTSTATAIDVPPLTVKATAGVPADFPATKDVETKQDPEVELPSSTTVEAVIETVVKQVTESQKEVKPVEDATVRTIDEADVSKIVSNEPATEGNTPTSDTKVDNIVELLNEANKGLNDQDSLTQSDNKRFVITEEIIKTDVEQEVEKSPEMLLNGMRVHADEPAAQEYVQTDLHILHIDQSDERMKPKEVIVNVPTGHIKATIQGRAVEKNRRNRDSWDILADEPKLTEKSPTDNKLVIEKGLFKRESHVNGNVIEQKHLSWNILDLKEQDEKLLDDFFKNGYMNEPVNKRNSNDIGFLFEKYQREREALKKLQEKETKRYSVGSMSDFSEISSVSDDEAPEESRKQEWSDIEDPEISLNKAISEGMDSDLFKPIQRSGNHVDPSTPKAETAPSSAFSPVLRRNENKATKPFSPSKQPLSPSKGKTEETKIKPLPEPVKPDFVPEVSTFSEEDLGSMVMAQAVSAVRKRRGNRGRGRRNVNAEQQLASQPAPTPETKTPEITAPVNTVPQSPPKPPRGIPKRTTAPVFEVSVETTQVAPLSQENVQKLNATLPLDRKRTDSSSNSTEATIKSSMRKPLQEPPITSPRSSSAQRMRDLNQNYLPSPKSPRLTQKSASMNFQAPTSPRLQPKALNLNQPQSPKSPRWEPTSPKSPRIQPSPRSAKHLTPRESGNKKLRPDFIANGNNNNNTRSYDYINSMPDIFHKSKLASGDIEYCEEDYNSEVSLMSDIGIDSTFEGSIVDDQMLVYPSLHTNANDIRSKAMINEFTDSSGDESFTTEQTDRFRQQIPTSATERTVYCGYTGCSHKQVMVGNEKSKFISCNSCFTCYCSKTCKRMHWLDHRKNCFFGRINVYIKTIVRKCEKENKFNSYLKTFALKNYRAIGRGCVVLTFNSPSEAKEMTSQKSAERLAHQPTYSTIDNVIKKNKQSKHSKVLCQSLLDYDPEQEFVVNISIRIGKTRTSNSKKRTSNVVRCARISSIEIPDLFDKALSSYYIRTFCLPRVAVNDYMNDVEVRRYYCKELSFSLKRCGVRLKLDYPEAYEKLSRYVEDERPFLPIVLYGQKSGKNYKCILHQGKYNHSEEARGEGVLV